MLKKRYYWKHQYQQQWASVLLLFSISIIFIIMLMTTTTTICSTRILVLQGATAATRTGFSSMSIRKRRFISTSSSPAFLSFPPRQPPWMIRPTQEPLEDGSSLGASAARRSSSSSSSSSNSSKPKTNMKMPKSSPLPPSRSSPRMRMPAATATASAAPSSLILPPQQQPSVMTKTKKQQQQQQTRRYYRLSSSLSSPSNTTSRGGGNCSSSRMADPQKTYILRVKGISSSKRPGVSTGSTGIGFVLLEQQQQQADDNNINATPAASLEEDCWIASSLYLEGSRSVFEAAYTAIVLGLQHAAMQRQVRHIILQIDHDVIYKQLMGDFKVQRESLVPLYWKIMQFKECFFQNNNNNGGSSFTIEYISPQQNELAKNLSTRALGTQTSQTLLWAQPDNESCNNDENNVDPMMMMQLLTTTDYSTTPAPPPAPPQEQTVAAATAQQTRAAHTLSTFDDGQTEDDEEAINTTAARETESGVYSYEERGGGVLDDEHGVSAIDIDPSKTYLLQFDGGARGNPGIAGGGMVLYDYDHEQQQQQQAREIWCGWEFFGTNLSNNQAEYQSLIRGLEAARALGIRHLIVQGDSELIVKQWNGIYGVKNANLRLYFSQVQALAAHFETFQIGHIRRAQNARADALANHAMDHQESHHGLLLPPSSSSFHQTVEVPPPVLLKQRQEHSTTRNEKNNTAVAIQKRQMSSFAAFNLEDDSSSNDENDDDDDRDIMSSSTILLNQLMNPSVRYVFNAEQALSYDVPRLYSGQGTTHDDIGINSAATRDEDMSQQPTASINGSMDTRDATLMSKVLSPPNSNTNAYNDDENCNVTGTKPLPSLKVPANAVNRMADEVPSTASDTTVATASLDIDSSKKYRLQFDGGSRGNPGLAGAGIVLYDDDIGKEVWCGHKFLGKDMTSNQAEYSSLLLGLEAAQSMGVRQLTVEGDSELIVRQINGIYKVRKLKKYYEAVQERIQKLDSFQIQQIPRAQNARADELANQAMDTLQSSGGLEDPLSLLQQRQRCTPMEIDSSKKYRLQFDGGFRGMFGVAGGGMVLYDDETGKEIWWGYKYLGKHLTSNQAEYSSLLLGLEAAQSLGVHQLKVESKSELIVRQLNGLYKVKNAKLREYYQAIQERIQKLDSFQIQLIPRTQNARAQELAYHAMETNQSSDGLEDPSLLLLQ